MKQTTHRLALVAMPWSKKERPSAALAALTAFARRAHPEWEVTPKSAYLAVYDRVGVAVYNALAADAYRMGELLYAALLYPERTESVEERFDAWVCARSLPAGTTLAQVSRVLQEHLGETATWAADANLLGLTTCFGQLFANLALARAVKQLNPECRVVLGGSTVSSRVGPSILREYAMVDAVVQGEGEAPLVSVMAAIQQRLPLGAGSSSVLTRPELAASALLQPASSLDEVRDLDDLPFPDYDEFAAEAAKYGVGWAIPIEGSRGCYWDRTKRANNPKSTCYFCNLNVQWGGYRQKSVARVARELVHSATRHQNVYAYFVDNILRKKGADELALALGRTGMDFDVFLEMRAHVSPHEFLSLWEVGLTGTQFGIEALSSSYLKRMGKGTTLIQNLQAMRLCAEFRVPHGANLLTHFPGTSQGEVDECVNVIRSHARGYQPLTLSVFNLGVGSTVDSLPEAFGIRNIRNAEVYRYGLPEAVWERLELFDLDYDVIFESADWTLLQQATEEWVSFHEGRDASQPAIRYRDGGSFIVVEDERFGALRHGTFEGVLREVLLECCEIRTREHVERLVADHGGTAEETSVILDHFVANGIMVTEGQRYLSLPVASTPRNAARRIREQHSRNQPKGLRSLNVVSG